MTYGKEDHNLYHAYWSRTFNFYKKKIKLVGFNIIEHLKSCVWNFKSTSTKNKFLITLQTSKLKASRIKTRTPRTLMNIRLKVKGKINKRYNKKHIQNEKCYEY